MAGNNDNDFIVNFGSNGAKDLEATLSRVSKQVYDIKKSSGDKRYTRSLEKETEAIKSFYKSIDSKNTKQAIKDVEKLLDNISKLNNQNYQSVRAGIISTKKEQSLIDAQTSAKAELDYKIKHRKELRQQAKEEKKINDYINGRNPALKTALSTIKKTVAKVISLKVAWNAVKKTFNFIYKANKSYGTFMETLNLAEVSFQNNAEAVVSWSKDYADSLGLSYNEVLKFASSLKSLTDTMGIADEVGTKMSTTLTTLIYNVSSLRNLDFDKAYTKIESTIFSGQLRTARTIGVDISVASMQALVEELGYAQIEYKNLTEAQKVQLRTIKVLRDLGSQSAGDLEKTLASTSNRLRILQSSWENLLTVIGNATNTVFSDLLAYVIGAVQGLSRFIQDLQPLTQSTGLQSTATAMGDVEEGIEGVNEQLGLLQIDKFETLTGAGDNKNSLSFDADVDDALNDYNKLNETMQNIDKTVKDVSDRFYEMFQSIDKETFREFANTLGDIVLKLPELATGLVRVLTDITNLFLKLYESNMLIPLIVALGTALLGFKILLMAKTPLGVILGASFLLGGSFASGKAISTAKSYNSSDIVSGIGGNTSKSNGSASTALQSTQIGSSQPIRVGLDINGREFASAVYNDLNYTNQRYTGASLGGN